MFIWPVDTYTSPSCSLRLVCRHASSFSERQLSSGNFLDSFSGSAVRLSGVCHVMPLRVVGKMGITELEKYDGKTLHIEISV